jgi:hypothetical protein
MKSPNFRTFGHTETTLRSFVEKFIRSAHCKLLPLNQFLRCLGFSLKSRFPVPNAVWGTARHPQAARCENSRDHLRRISESTTQGFWQAVERPLWGALGDARLSVDHTPGVPPQCWATCELRREFTNGLHRLFQAKPYVTCKSLLDTWAVPNNYQDRRIIKGQCD